MPPAPPATAGLREIHVALDGSRQERRDRFRGTDDRRVRAVPRRQMPFAVRPTTSDSGPSILIPSGPIRSHALIPSTTPGLTDIPSGNVTTVSRKCGVAGASGVSLSGTSYPHPSPPVHRPATCPVPHRQTDRTATITPRHGGHTRRLFRIPSLYARSIPTLPGSSHNPRAPSPPADPPHNRYPTTRTAHRRDSHRIHHHRFVAGTSEARLRPVSCNKPRIGSWLGSPGTPQNVISKPNDNVRMTF